MFHKAIHDFVSRVASLDDLPPAVAAAIHPHTLAESIEAILTLPAQRYPLSRFNRWRVLPFGWRVTPPRTLVFTPEALLIAETGAAGAVTLRQVPLACLIELEVTVNLLYGCLEVQWAEDGEVTALRLEFSAVGLRLIRSALDAWRAGLPRAAADDTPGVSLADLPLKFRNYLRTALLPGERVRAVCFQAEIGSAGGIWRLRLTPNRTIALTDWHVIVLAEDMTRTLANYSLITQIIPWRGVRGLEVAARDDELAEALLALGLGDATCDRRWLLGRPEAEALRAAFEGMAAGRRVLPDAG